MFILSYVVFVKNRSDLSLETGYARFQEINCPDMLTSIFEANELLRDGVLCEKGVPLAQQRIQMGTIVNKTDRGEKYIYPVPKDIKPRALHLL